MTPQLRHELTNDLWQRLAPLRPTQRPRTGRLFDGEKRASDLSIIRLTIALVACPELVDRLPADVPNNLNSLTNAQVSDAIADLPESRGWTLKAP